MTTQPASAASPSSGPTHAVSVDVVRVFTNETGGFGNELGLIWSTHQTRGHEQRIAQQLGFSETVFVDQVDDADAAPAGQKVGQESGQAAPRTATIRIFTPVTELPFAGHPSVGTAWWLRDSGAPVQALREAAGTVAVRYDDELTWITGRADWAPTFEWIPLDTPSEVEGLDPAAFTDGHHYAWAWFNEETGELRSRMFAPEMGIAEDEATGAAAVRITADLGRDLEITQGRGSLISTRVGEGGSIDVGGRTVFDRSLRLDLSLL